jgi:uncharacterized protein (DUF3084 family)
MTADELLTHLESELARCRDERDRLRAELEGALTERDQALRESALAERMLIAAENERDRLHAALHSLIGSKSWLLTRPLRRLTGSDRPEAAEDL